MSFKHIINQKLEYINHIPLTSMFEEYKKSALDVGDFYEILAISITYGPNFGEKSAKWFDLALKLVDENEFPYEDFFSYFKTVKVMNLCVKSESFPLIMNSVSTIDLSGLSFKLHAKIIPLIKSAIINSKSITNILWGEIFDAKEEVIKFLEEIKINTSIQYFNGRKI